MVPKEIHMRLPLHIQDEETFFLQNHSFQSRDMVRHLQNCQEVVLFAATLGTGVDQLIRRSEVLDMSMAVILQACAAEAIESWCDMCEAELSKEMENEHLYLRPRFSPGYGDFSRVAANVTDAKTNWPHCHRELFNGAYQIGFGSDWPYYA